MQIVNSGAPFSLSYGTYDRASGLFVAAKVYDVSSGTPVFVSLVVLTEVSEGLYAGNFSAVATKSYLGIAAVFTDNTYTTPDLTRSPVAEVYKTVDAPISFVGVNYGSYDFETGLNLQASVYDVTAVPVLDQNVVMPYVDLGIYFASFVGVINSVYEVVKLVFTDNTFTTVSPDYSPGSDSIGVFSMPPPVLVPVPGSSAVLKGQELTAILKEGAC